MVEERGGRNFELMRDKMIFTVMAVVFFVTTVFAEPNFDTFIEKNGYKINYKQILRAGEFKGATEIVYSDVDGLITINKITAPDGKILQIAIIAPITCFVSKFDFAMIEKMGKNDYDMVKLTSTARLAIFLVEVFNADDQMTEWITAVAQKGDIKEEKKQFGNYKIGVLADPAWTIVVISAVPISDYYRVTKVVDGDTIKLDNGETVRLIGVNTPEVAETEEIMQKWDREIRIAIYELGPYASETQKAQVKLKFLNKQLEELKTGSKAQEFSAFTRNMCEGKNVWLEYDQKKRDKYGRLLAYVYLEDGTDVNAEIIKQGYGQAYTRFPFKRMEEFWQYERVAKEQRIGLWE